MDQAAVGVVSGVIGRYTSGIGQEARRAKPVITEVGPIRPLPLPDDIQPHQIIGVAAGGELPKHLRQPVLSIEQVIGLNAIDDLLTNAIMSNLSVNFSQVFQ